MTFDPVPWVVGGGAAITPEMARVVAYQAFQGNQGVMGRDDLRVSQLSTPGASVQIAPGACAVVCRTPGYGYQSYAGRNPDVDTEPVVATGAGGGRSDMVVVRVEDPWLPGEPWPDPVDVAVGPYIYGRVLANVGAAAIASRTAARAYLASQGFSAIPLAGITLPASTGAVLNSHLTDLRAIANPRRQPRKLTYNPGAALTVTSATFADWVYLATPWQVEVPDWATQMAISVNVGGARVDRSTTTVNGTAIGQVRAQLGRDANAAYSQAVGYDYDTPFQSVGTRYTLVLGDTIAVPAAYRGTVQNVSVQALKSSGNKNLFADTSSAFVVDVEFSEAAI